MEKKLKFIVSIIPCPDCNETSEEEVEATTFGFQTQQGAENFIKDIYREFHGIAIARHYDHETNGKIEHFH